MPCGTDKRLRFELGAPQRPTRVPRDIKAKEDNDPDECGLR